MDHKTAHDILSELKSTPNINTKASRSINGNLLYQGNLSKDEIFYDIFDKDKCLKTSNTQYILPIARSNSFEDAEREEIYDKIVNKKDGMLKVIERNSKIVNIISQMKMDLEKYDKSSKKDEIISLLSSSSGSSFLSVEEKKSVPSAVSLDCVDVRDLPGLYSRFAMDKQKEEITKWSPVLIHESEPPKYACSLLASDDEEKKSKKKNKKPQKIKKGTTDDNEMLSNQVTTPEDKQEPRAKSKHTKRNKKHKNVENKTRNKKSCQLNKTDQVGSEKKDLDSDCGSNRIISAVIRFPPNDKNNKAKKSIRSIDVENFIKENFKKQSQSKIKHREMGNMSIFPEGFKASKDTSKIKSEGMLLKKLKNEEKSIKNLSTTKSLKRVKTKKSVKVVGLSNLIEEKFTDIMNISPTTALTLMLLAADKQK